MFELYKLHLTKGIFFFKKQIDLKINGTNNFPTTAVLLNY